jgi:predicted Fe-S protein YdhL (DUF1289 family)
VPKTAGKHGKTASPCTKECKLDKRRVCKGCGRLAEEISRWKRMSDEERRAVLHRLKRERR